MQEVRLPLDLVLAVLDVVSDAAFVFDGDGRLTYRNPAAAELTRQVGDVVAGAEGALRRALAERGARSIPLAGDGGLAGEVILVAPIETTGATLADRECRAILETLTATGWRLAESARRLGISRTTLWRRLTRYGLERPRR